MCLSYAPCRLSCTSFLIYDQDGSYIYSMSAGIALGAPIIQSWFVTVVHRMGGVSSAVAATR